MTTDKLRRAMEILTKYEASDYVASEHDEMFAGSVPPEKMIQDDVKELEELGWSWDDSLPCWRAFT